ncbi:hypothetical protein A2V61_02455 [Candidatus Woesebacteria bacterium RBG_19FT_COMBO_47_8]|uniref:Peptidase C39 domain-containing protein n=1 Tax=Candidatus Woesebacteria bacterium RBG_13_46_13 TaxID=1802479 RepID=A0A1F7X5F6_9BACT|nr:MAG: hypothetical protein A2Y68_00735 [Candidatus Woesebacteria bacterium RBG_13_46_13]OGM17175.1 MAG: hypothetical protein A2V61_02455 [Candidatus Woesebacteria bacterium RBG_19FT_COMBO_47_8]HJX59441.1 C39 family peptidase [Patescibacteria group bacterium]
MQKLFSNPYFPELSRVTQITSSHCGPATLEMLLGFLGIEVDQEAIVETTGVGQKLPVHGMIISEMGEAVRKLAPQVQFWFKANSSLNELSQLVRNYKYPVGIEWQGVFYEDADDDNGHYSVITHIDTTNNIIMVADPYKRFAGTDRIFHILEFEDRWWDENEIKDPYTGKVSQERDYHMMFVITPKQENFPETFEMIRG